MKPTQTRIAVPRAARKGEIVELRALARHPMETGWRVDSVGKRIARDIVARFTCTLDGRVLFAADLFPAIAANPYLSFFIRAEQSGELVFEWTDLQGESVRETARLTVN